MTNKFPPPQPQPPVMEIPDRVFKTSKNIMAPLYLTNNRWDINKSEARKKELIAQRSAREAQRKVKLQQELISPTSYERGIALLIDLIDDNDYHPQPNEITTDKVKF